MSLSTQNTVVRHVYPNGLILLVQEEHTHPLVAFEAVVRTGSATEGEFAGSGISHVVEHMLFKGTQRRPVGAVEKEARSYGGTFGGATTYDSTSYDILINKEYWSEAADLMLDALFHPSMDESEFLKERNVVLRELKLREDDPDRMIWDLLFTNAYQVHPYRIPIIGYEPLVSQISREDILRYHHLHYQPNNMVLSVVGDLQAQEVIHRIGELTADLPPGRVQIASAPPEPPVLFPRVIGEEADVQLGMLAVGFHSVPLTHPDLFALDFLAHLLGGTRGSRLDVALKESGIVHSVSAFNYTPNQPGLFVFSMRLDPDKFDAAQDVLWEQIKRVQSEPFAVHELEVAKKAFLRGYLASQQTVGGMAADIASSEVHLGDPQFSKRYVEQIQAMTSEQLQAVAAKYLQAKKKVQVQLHPRGTLAKAPSAQESESAVLKTERVELKNGVVVLLRPDARVPLTTLQAVVLAGVRYETEQTNGFSKLTGRMLTRGTRLHTAEEITQRAKEIGGAVSSFSGRNSLGVTLEVMKSGTTEGIDLVAELIRESHFPEEELAKQRTLALAGLKAEMEDPFQWGFRKLAETLFTEHPYRLSPSGSEQGIRNAGQEGLADFYRNILDPSRLVIGVVGDFDREAVLKQLQTNFGSLKFAGVQPDEVPKEPPLAEQKMRKEVTPRQEGLILIGFHGLSVSDERLPQLDLIQAVLSGGAGRLFHEVREERGLAYTVGAFGVPGLDPGSFVLYAVAEPQKLGEVRSALLEELKRLHRDKIPEKELHEARQGLLGSRRIARQTQGAFVAQMTLDELYGLGFDFPDRYEAALKEVTAQQLQELAKELLNAERAVIFIGEPKDASGAAQVQEAKAGAL